MSLGGATGSSAGGKGGAVQPTSDPNSALGTGPADPLGAPASGPADPNATYGGGLSAMQQATGGDVYGQSSQALSGALGQTYGAMGQNAMGGPSTIAQPDSIQSGISGYMNPYTDEVINRTMGDIDQSRQMALSQNQADAANAGSFGGSRHGLVDAETNANAFGQMADTSSQMRNNQYGQAAALSGQDIGNQMQGGMFNAGATNQFQNDQFARSMAGAGMLGNLGNQAFGTGQAIEQSQAQQGLMQQAMNQSILDQGQRMYGQYSDQPQELLNLRLGALGQNPLNAATTSTKTTTPGMFDYLQMGAGVAGAAMMA